MRILTTSKNKEKLLGLERLRAILKLEKQKKPP